MYITSKTRSVNAQQSTKYYVLVAGEGFKIISNKEKHADVDRKLVKKGA